MGSTPNTPSGLKENVVYSISNETRLRKLIFGKKINLVSQEDYSKSRLNAYVAVK
jgi:hypothetical protein